MGRETEQPLTRREAIARERSSSARPRERTRRPRDRADRPRVPVRSEPRPAVRSTGRPVASLAHRMAQKMLAGGVLLFAAALVIGLSVPANALYVPGSAAAAEPASRVVAGADQALPVDGTDLAIPTTTSEYTASTRAQLLAQKYRGAGTQVGGAWSGPVRWPFPHPVAILSPYGPRTPPPGCPECSPFHSGVDLAGGNGNPIFSIADGVVAERSGGSWTYGNYAKIVSRVDGHEITAIYEHMQEGSSPLVVGQQVQVGDFVGLVGQTGEATAPHLHLEIDVDGARTDPIPWLTEYAS